MYFTTDTDPPYLNITSAINVTVGETVDVTITLVDPNGSPLDVALEFLGTVPVTNYTLTLDSSQDNEAVYTFSWTPHDSTPVTVM